MSGSPYLQIPVKFAISSFLFRGFAYPQVRLQPRQRVRAGNKTIAEHQSFAIPVNLVEPADMVNKAEAAHLRPYCFQSTMADAFRLVAGAVKIPKGPGLGIEMDETKVAARVEQSKVVV